MIFTVPQQIAALSEIVSLEPGDLILTGTPAGTAAAHGHRYLTPGDHVVAEVEGLGQLTTLIAGG
jgi:2-keto-4-pentenoate hydratase/2-oxohepta-3-ene-1,7-dioic acid hydratase in catechol pathway